MAGKQKGLTQGSGTRSGLLWECERIIEGKRPPYLMMENVKALVGKKNMPDFQLWLDTLEGLGYNNHWQVVNSRFCGVPQNRERVFCVSILKDVDDGLFCFNEPFDSGLRVRDILESEVDEKYYISNKAFKYMFWKRDAKRIRWECHTNDPEGFADTLTVNMYKGVPYGVVTSDSFRDSARVYAARITGRNPDNPTSRKSGEPTVQMLEINKNPGVSNCITTVQKDALLLEEWHENERVRRLTPTECFRLRGVSEEDIEVIRTTGLKDTALYKLAGNSIVVDAMAFLKNI